VKYRAFVAIIEQHGFVCVRTRGSHRQYKAVIDGQTRLVTVDYDQPGNDIMINNLKSMIRQSGLDKKLFKPGI
jgi:predicted RNA binding protein YcfA (HicA-like mRNA interferase family)